MTSVPFIAFYPSDWRGGVAMLTDFEELVYLKICLAIWGDGHPVHEDDVSRLFRREPDADEVKAACATLLRLRKLQRDDDGNLTNERALEAYRDAQKRVRAGKKGAASRWKNKRKRENAAAVRQQVPPQCQPEPESEPESQTPKRESEGARKALPLDDFVPSEATMTHGREKGLDDDRIYDAAERYRNWCIANDKRRTERGHQAGLRNWLAKDAEDARRSPQGARNGHGRRTQREIKHDLALAAREIVDEERRGGALGGEAPAFDA